MFHFVKGVIIGHSGALGAIAMSRVVLEPEPLLERARVPARASGLPRDGQFVIIRITVQVYKHLVYSWHNFKQLSKKHFDEIYNKSTKQSILQLLIDILA